MSELTRQEQVDQFLALMHKIEDLKNELRTAETKLYDLGYGAVYVQRVPNPRDEESNDL